MNSRSPGRHFLQIPGPTDVPGRVLRAISEPTIDHRGPGFADLGRSVLTGLKRVFQTSGPVLVFPASGTGAWEAALVNTLSTFSGPLVMEYNYQGRTMPHLPKCLDFKDGKLYPNDRPGLGVEVDFSQLEQIAEFTEPDFQRGQIYYRTDGSITNW